MSGFNAVGTQAIGTNEVSIDESGSLTASSKQNLTENGIAVESGDLTSNSFVSITENAIASESPSLDANSLVSAKENNISVSESATLTAGSKFTINETAIADTLSAIVSVSSTAIDDKSIAKESGVASASGSSTIKKKEKEFPKVSPTVAQLGSTKEVEIKTASQSFDVTAPVIQNDNIDFTVKSPTIREYSHNEELEFSAKKTFSKEIQVKTPIVISNSLQKFVTSDIIVKEYKDKKVETPVIISDSKSIDMDWNKNNTKKIISAL